MDLTAAARPTIRVEIQLARIHIKSRVALRDWMRLASYPGLLDLCSSFMEAYRSGFFSCVSTASDLGKNIRVTLIPLHYIYAYIEGVPRMRYA